MSSSDLVGAVFPEAGAGGFSRVDGTVAFYNRVQALLRPEMVVVDHGAGRGAAFTEDRCRYRRELRTLRGKVAKVIGLDVDPMVMGRPIDAGSGFNEAVTIGTSCRRSVALTRSLTDVIRHAPLSDGARS